MKLPPLSMALIPISLALLSGCERQQPVEPAAPTPPAEAAASGPGAGIPTTVTGMDAANLPPGLMAVVTAEVPGMMVEEVERKEREGRVYFDVEGKRPDGSEVEMDILQEGSTYQVVEIQRDMAWSDAPAVARDAAAAGGLDFEPVRVIESRQTDGSVIFELFAEGRPDKPSKEVRVKDGKAEVLAEEWKH